MKITKRDGRLVDYDGSKIINAVAKAMKEITGKVDKETCYRVEEEVLKTLQASNYPLTVEGIQDSVENTLMSLENCNEVAKAYILYRAKRNETRKKQWEMNDLQSSIYNSKYRYNNESFDEFLSRVSGGDNNIYKLMQSKKFIPAGRILAGRGLNEKGQKVCYSNCFVITPPEDNLESIFDTAKKMARTYSYGGGCGTSLEHLRPNKAKVNNSAKITSGAVSFTELYSTTTGLIGQNNRRGALMLSMPVSHPDIVEFIDIKNDLEAVTKANLSVMVSDKFMKAVKEDSEWEMRYEVEDTGEVISKTMKARNLMFIISKSAHRMGEPGMLFWDRVKNYHINSENDVFEYVSTNPCGEKPLPSGGSCLLGSMNLAEYVLPNGTFDYDNFSEDVKSVTVYMNDVLEEGIKYLPLEEQRESAKKFRQLGIGILGMGDMLIKLGLKYGDKPSLKLMDSIMKEMANSALQQSAIIARDRGTYESSDVNKILKSEYIKTVATKKTIELIKKYGLRNAELLSIAPTGSISTMLGVSGGTEPIFQTSYTRKVESITDENGEPQYFTVYTPIVKEYMEKHGLTDEKELPDYFVTAPELDYKKRIDMQSVLQKYVDSAISSTINLPNETTIEEVADIYMYAWEKGLKGVTVFRDGCERSGILISNETKNKQDNSDSELQIAQKELIDFTTNILLEYPEVFTKIQEKRGELGIDNIINKKLEDDPGKCPVCGGKIMHSGGCEECQDCGYSPCSI